MKTEKIRGAEVMEMQIRNLQWTVKDWQNWADKSHIGLIIEDGKVKGYETIPTQYHT